MIMSNFPAVNFDADAALSLAQRVLSIEAEAVMAMRDRLDGQFVEAMALILDCRGRVVVSGMGKSGHVGGKIAATLASTGTPAFFVHPGEASHGDLGMITHEDVCIALSNSGESAELTAIVPLIKRRGARLIAMTGNPQSTSRAKRTCTSMPAWRRKPVRSIWRLPRVPRQRWRWAMR
jgi:Predicted sugar phosphate isomerase involved in capsule formation